MMLAKHAWALSAMLSSIACTPLSGLRSLTFSEGGAGGTDAGTGGAGIGGAGIGGAGMGGGGTGGATDCGNGTIDDGETCDDGGAMAGDGCNETCQVECDDGFLHPTHNTCFFLSPLPIHTWTEGVAWCAARGAGWRVATPALEGEQNLIFATASVIAVFDAGERIWVGGSDALMEGDFTWVNGEPWADPAGWAPGQPDDNAPPPGEDCVNMARLNNELGLNDDPCTDANHVLCERPPAGTPP